MSEPLLPENDWVLLTLLPKPSIVPDIRRNEIMGDAVSALSEHFSSRPDVLVGTQGFLCLDNDTDSSTWVKMDLVVAFDVIPKAIIGRNGFMVREVGKPPDFVLQVVPGILEEPDLMVADIGGKFRPDEMRRDYDHARTLRLYEVYGVREYWRLAPEGGPCQDEPLVGFRLRDNGYESIPVTRDPDEEIRGYSQTLDLHLCWNGSKLRWLAGQGGRYLMNYPELADALDEANRERDEEKALRVEAEYRRFVAEERVRRMEEIVRSLHYEQSGGQSDGQTAPNGPTSRRP